MKFDGVFCSRLDRSKETASIVAGTPRVVPGFDEMHYGTVSTHLAYLWIADTLSWKARL